MAAVALCPAAPGPQAAVGMAPLARIEGVEEQMATLMAMLTGFMEQVRRQHEGLLARAAQAEASSAECGRRLCCLEERVLGEAVSSTLPARKLTAPVTAQPLQVDEVAPGRHASKPQEAVEEASRASEATPPRPPLEAVADARVHEEQEPVAPELPQGSVAAAQMAGAEAPASAIVEAEELREAACGAAGAAEAAEAAEEKEAALEVAPEVAAPPPPLVEEGSPACLEQVEQASEGSTPEWLVPAEEEYGPSVVEEVARREASEPLGVEEPLSVEEPPVVNEAREKEPEPEAEAEAEAEAADSVAADAEANAPAAAPGRRRPAPVRPVPQVLDIREPSTSSGLSRDWEQDIDLQGGSTARFKDGRLTVRICELPLADGVNGSTGHQIWPGSVVLASELLRRPQLVLGKRVLEMGSGCALVGIAASHMARYTLMTDHDDEVVTNVEKNLRFNARSWLAKDGEPRREVAVCRLNWDDVPSYGWAEEDRFETILAAEVIYGNWGDKVARAMVEMLAPGGTMLMSVSEDRRGSIGAFKEHIFLSGFKVLETKIHAPAGTVRIYECTKQQKGEETFTLRERDDTEQDSPWRPKQSPEPVVVERRDDKKVVPVNSRPVNPPTPPLDPFGARRSISPNKPSRWRVVGGVEKGIIVRDGSDGAKSTYKGRLEHGALVEEVQRIANRVAYVLIRGEGPTEGWVSLFSAKGAKLLIEHGV